MNSVHLQLVYYTMKKSSKPKNWLKKWCEKARNLRNMQAIRGWFCWLKKWCEKARNLRNMQAIRGWFFNQLRRLNRWWNKNEKPRKVRNNLLQVLKRRFIQKLQSLFQEGYLGDTFLEIQDADNPQNLIEVISLFSKESEELIASITMALSLTLVEYSKMDIHIKELIWRSSSVGAVGLVNCCECFKEFCDKQDAEGCKIVLEKLEKEYEELKNRLTRLIGLGKRLVTVGGSFPLVTEN